MEMGTHTVEKRDFMRIKVDSMASFTLPGQSGELHTARCLDLSGVGMQLETSKRLNNGTALEITMPSTRATLPPLKMCGRIVWTKYTRDTSMYRYGISIERME